MTDDLLFFRSNLRDVLERQEHRMREEIDAIDGNRLLNTAVEDLCGYFEDKYLIHVPKLDEDGIQVDQSEARVDVSQDHSRVVYDRSRPVYVAGTRISFIAPFEGDRELFHCKPSTYDLNPPHASVSHAELTLTYVRTGHNAEDLKRTFERDLADIKRYLGWIAKDTDSFNASLRTKARSRVEARREKLLKDQGLVANLGFPLRRRENAPQTYVVPSVRRKVAPGLPPASVEPYIPEPVLEMREYEHILSVMSNMVAVMERSPRAFRNMHEEDLRQHFLVQLNAQYEGQATGETFNGHGKTDILIRVEGKNIFIAECLFWHGPKSLTDKIDQLLGYTTWRDTKLALLVFNRGGAFSAVVGKVPETVKAHPSFKHELSLPVETGYRCVIRHRDDPNREMLLTVLAFEVPA